MVLLFAAVGLLAFEFVFRLRDGLLGRIKEDFGNLRVRR